MFIQLFQKTLSKEKQTSHKPRPQGSMGSFKSVFIAAVNRELKGNLRTDDSDARDDALQNMDLNFTLKFRSERKSITNLNQGHIDKSEKKN